MSELVGNVQQTADEVRVTDREMNAIQWPKPPRHGDQIVYADRTSRVVLGRAKVELLDRGHRLHPDNAGRMSDVTRGLG